MGGDNIPEAEANIHGQTADVDVIKPNGEIESHANIPVIQLFDTPGDITIMKSQYQQGVVVLNEWPIGANPAKTKDNPRFHLDYQVPDNEIMVHVPHNVGYPSGRIVLWQ